jgi:hypothetical protein
MVGQVVIMNIYYRSYLKLDIGKFWREIAKILPAVLCPLGLAVLFLRVVPSAQLFGFMANVIFYTVAYSGSMYLIGMNRYEKQLVVDPLRRMIGKVRGAKG